MKKKHIVLTTLIGTLLTSSTLFGCTSVPFPIHEYGKCDGEAMDLRYDEAYKTGEELLLGCWYNEDMDYQMTVYQENDSLYIAGDQFGNYRIYEMEIEQDEFDTESGDFILTLKTDASNMSCQYMFSYTKDNEFIYYGNLKYYKTSDDENIIGDDLERITDLEKAKILFPNLDGIESCEFEYYRLGPTNEVSRVPGPSTYQANGYIVLDDTIMQKYIDQYEWTSATPNIEMLEIFTRNFENNEWLSSDNFKYDVKNPSYNGTLYINENTIWFSLSN